MFTLLSILQEIRECQHDTHVVFIKIVKAFDSVDYDLIPIVLERLGAPPKIVHVFNKMYINFRFTLKVGKIASEILLGRGVQQGDNLTPTLFAFFMQVVAEAILCEIKEQNVSIPCFQNTCNWAGPIQRYTQKEQKKTTTHLTSDQVFLLLYVDDGAAVFENFHDATIVTSIIQLTMAAFGLTLHLEIKDNQNSKTEAMFFPNRNTLQKWRSEW